MINDIFNLKGFNSVHDPTVSNEILDSLVEFFDWGLLQKGNYFNVELGETDRQGNDLSRLSVSKSRSFTQGSAWDAINPNWVWQSGVEHSPQPLIPDGIYLDDNFLPLDSLTNPYYIDYYNGRVVFESPIPSSSKVQVVHSYKWINVDYANSIGTMKSILEQEDTLPPELTVKLPLISIEVVNRNKMTGYELGGGQWIDTMVLFYCIARNEPIKNRMVDIVSYQNDKSIFTFNSMKIAQNGDFPLDQNGTPKDDALNFKELVAQYPRYKLRFSNVSTSSMTMKENNLFGGVVKMDVELAKHDI